MSDDRPKTPPDDPWVPSWEPDFDGLAARLDSLALRAKLHGWSGWTPEDTRTIVEAVAEIEAIPEVLEKIITDAFAIGRECGRDEELFAGVKHGVLEESSHVARKAWGERHASHRWDRVDPGDPAGSH